MNATPSSLLRQPSALLPTVGEAHGALLPFATGAAALLGTLYALSPLTVLLAVLVAALIRGACAGTGPRERRWILVLLLSAAAARAAAIAYLALTTDTDQQSFRTMFGDGLYALERSLWLRNTVLGVGVAPIDYVEAFKDYGRSGYHYQLAWVQVVFGPAPYGVHALSVILYVTGAIVLFREVRRSFGVGTAFIGLALTLCLPTLLLWSISPLKESAYFSMSSIAVASTLRALRARPWPRAVVAGLLITAMLTGIATLRSGGLAIALGGLIAGLMLAALMRHRWVATAAVVIVIPIVAAVTLPRPSVQEALLSRIRQGAALHVGHVNTPGSSYKLLDQGYYNINLDTAAMTREEALRYAAAAIFSFVLIPKPWAPATWSDVAMTPQQLVWYLIVAFSVPGLVAGLRRDSLLTCLLIANVLVGAAVIAPASGNVGTLIRHRDMVVPFLVWIGALGCVATLGWYGNDVRQEG